MQLNNAFVLRANNAAPIVIPNRGPGQTAKPEPRSFIRLLALDSRDFAAVSWFRPDFAQEPLGAMMSRLAAMPDGILVPREILAQYDLQIGDQFGATVGTTCSTKISTQFTIVGTYDYFPTI